MIDRQTGNTFSCSTDQLDVAVVVEHEVFRLEITVDDTLAVQVLERLDDAGDAESRRDVIEVTSENILHIQRTPFDFIAK